MRHLHFYLLGFVALFAACQPVTPITVNTKALPKTTAAANVQTKIDLVVSTVTKDADNATESVNNSDTGSGTNNSTDETAIATILAAPPVQPTPVQPKPVQPPFRPNAMIRNGG